MHSHSPRSPQRESSTFPRIICRIIRIFFRWWKVVCFFVLLGVILLFIYPKTQVSYQPGGSTIFDPLNISLQRFQDKSRKNKLYNQFENYCGQNSSQHEYIFNSSLLRIQEFEFQLYLLALYGSVQIFTVPNSKVFSTAIRDCSRHVKPSIDYSQHSLEQILPWTLLKMKLMSGAGLDSNISEPQPPNFLLRRYFALLWDDNINNSSLQGFEKPLFYYIHMLPYLVVYCTKKSRDRENWEAGLQYTIDVARDVVGSEEWALNSGIDFFSPASHPKTGPLNTHENILKSFTRHTFLRTDFDHLGYSPKDIIVPYYVPFKNIKNHNLDSRLLLFFAGGDNPPGGLRSQFQKSFLELAQRSDSENNLRDVFFTTSSSLSSKEYSRYMSRSDFCLMLRGDTASSKRLFSAVSYGCIPVIVSDWIPLPFEALLDYSQFTLRFSESSFRNADGLLNYLRTEVGAERKAALQRNLLLARSLLLYRSEDENECFPLNPVSLIFIEAFIRRKEYCDKLTVPNSNSMCIQVYSRLKGAKQLLSKIG